MGTRKKMVHEQIADAVNQLKKLTPSREVSIVITHLETADLWLEKVKED